MQSSVRLGGQLASILNLVTCVVLTLDMYALMVPERLGEHVYRMLISGNTLTRLSNRRISTRCSFSCYVRRQLTSACVNASSRVDGTVLIDDRSCPHVRPLTCHHGKTWPTFIVQCVLVLTYKLLV